MTPADPDTLSRLRRNSPMPIAADESVESTQSAQALADSAAVDLLVIKLARVGGFTAARSIIEHARTRNLDIVLTSSLDTGIGLTAAAHLASALDLSRASGLSTGPLLIHDLLQTPITPNNGSLSTPNSPGLGIALDPDAIQRFALGPRGRARL